MTVIIVLALWIGSVAFVGFLIKMLGQMNNFVFSGADALLVGSLCAGRHAINLGFLIAIVGLVPYIGTFISSILMIVFIICLVHAFPLLFGWVIALVMGIIGDQVLYSLPVPMLKFYNGVSPISLEGLIDYREGRADDCLEIFFYKEDLAHNPEFIQWALKEYR